MKILYIAKLKNSRSNGVSVAVCQLLNSICNYAEIALLNLSEIDFPLNNSIIVLDKNNWTRFDADIAVFEDPFNTIEFCRIAHLLRKKKIPYVLVPHGCFTYIALQKHAIKKKLAMNTVFREYLNGCIATQYLCKDEKDNSIQYNKAIILPNGIPFPNKTKTVDRIQKIVFISRKDVRHKGLDYLFDAISQTKELLELHRISIDLYGSEESDKDENYINEYIEKHQLQSILHNYGPVFGEDKERVLLNSDLFILTSRHEGFPMSILEALSYGLPVLITSGTNMADIVSDANAGWTGITDSDVIAKLLVNAIQSEDCTIISKNARNLALKYSWDKIAEDTICQYRALLNKQSLRS